jgi:hypothetical protein
VKSTPVMWQPVGDCELKARLRARWGGTSLDHISEPIEFGLVLGWHRFTDRAVPWNSKTKLHL